MVGITATMVKALRDQTGQGMMECKKALVESDGDAEAAGELLRKKGLASADKRAERTTSEGLIAIKLDDEGKSGVMVEVQCETDFCSRNDVFGAMVGAVAELASDAPEGEVQSSDAIAAAVHGALAKIGENMSYARGVKIAAPRIGTYLHHNGKVGVMVGVDGEIDEDMLSGLCMHVAFADPMGITVDDIPSELVEKEKRFATQQAIDSGKPAEIAEKIVTGKMRKFLAARALLEQAFVRDEQKKVKDILGDAKVTCFARYSVGG